MNLGYFFGFGYCLNQFEIFIGTTRKSVEQHFEQLIAIAESPFLFYEAKLQMDFTFINANIRLALLKLQRIRFHWNESTLKDVRGRTA